ncbi:MAG: DUF302 domain-containing protein [Nitrospirae bacterium]|uniref:DUF302 domain-containing protein n=1 Tax=Candidatus Magnetobacterium casense TaxID=1455061 RepID=UPI00058CCA86|nr:DUF302 domain-containing protein [Candidatus Magnetobacterium casensis]MBF0337442.1 DUF302 domain-containing protein [Nitrospirota bacterium]
MDTKFDYTVETAKGFDKVVEDITERSKANGFGVLHIHDVKATLASKGYDRSALKIIEVCNPGYAYKVLKADIKISLMLPCPICVYEEGGKVFVSALRPNIIADFYPDAGIKAVAQDVDKAILKIVQEAV